MKKSLILFIILSFVISIPLNPLTARSEIDWKLAHKFPPESPEGKAYQLFADEVSRLSNGKMKFKVYHSEQLGAVGASLDMLRRNTIQMYNAGISYLHSFVPQFYIPTLPFVFRDRAHLMKFVQSPMLNTWKEELLEKAGIRILGYGEFVRGPYRTLLSTRPVLKLEDVQGLKLRMYKSEMVMSIWKELGANVIYLAQAETYEGLKRGLVEAATFPIANIETMHFQEVAKFILQTNEFPQSVGFFVNEKAYQSLPEDLKKILLKAYEESCEYTQANMEKAAEESLDRMIRKDKVTFIRTPMDAFREKVKPLYRKWEAEGKYGLKKGIIDDIAGL